MTPSRDTLDQRLHAVENRLHAMRTHLKLLLIAETTSSSSSSSSQSNSSSSISVLPSQFVSKSNANLISLTPHHTHDSSLQLSKQNNPSHSISPPLPPLSLPPPPLPPPPPPPPLPPPPPPPLIRNLSPAKEALALEHCPNSPQKSRIEQKLDALHAAITSALSLLQSQPTAPPPIQSPSSTATFTPLKKKPSPQHANKVFDARQAMLEELKKRIAIRKQSAEAGALSNYT